MAAWASKTVPTVPDNLSDDDIDDYARALAELEVSAVSPIDAAPSGAGRARLQGLLPHDPPLTWSSADQVAAAVEVDAPDPPSRATGQRRRASSSTTDRRPAATRPGWTGPKAIPTEYRDFAEGRENRSSGEDGGARQPQKMVHRTPSSVRELRKAEKRIRKLEAQLQQSSADVAALGGHLDKARFEVKTLRENTRQLELKYEEESRKIKLQHAKEKEADEDMILRQLEKRQRHPGQNADDIEELDVDFTVGVDGVLKQLMTYITRRASYIYTRYAPFRKDIKYIQARFGESIALYFVFHTWILVTAAALSAICFFVFGVAHLTNLLRDGVDPTSQIVVFPPDTPAPPGAVATAAPEGPNGTSQGNSTVLVSNSLASMFPFKWLWFGGYQSGERMLYSVTLVAIALVYLCAFLRKLVVSMRVSSYKHYEEEYFNSVKYSKTALGMLDISARSKKDEEVQRLSSVAALQTLIHHDNRERTEFTPTSLIVRRVVLGVFTVLLILASWVALLVIILEEVAIIEAFGGSKNGGSVVDTLASFVPSALITMTTMSLPPALILITKLEKWENPELVLVLLVVRIYFSQIASLIVVIIQGYDAIFGFLSPLSNSGDSCPPDTLAIGFLRLCILKVLGKMLGSLMYIHTKNIAFTKILKKADGRSEFNTAREIVDLLYVQALLWLILPFSPAFLVVGSVLLCILLKFEIYLVIHKLKRPALLWSPKQTTAWFLLLYFITFALCQSANYYVLAYFTGHTCGPFSGADVSVLGWLNGRIRSSEASAILVDIATSPLLLISLCIATLMVVFKKQFQREALSEHISYCKEQLKTDSETYTKQIGSLKGQVAELQDALIDNRHYF